MKEIGQVIRNRRKLLGVSQSQLATIAGVGINTLTKIERGEGNPSLSVLMRVLNSLGLVLSVKVKGTEV